MAQRKILLQHLGELDTITCSIAKMQPTDLIVDRTDDEVTLIRDGRIALDMMLYLQRHHKLAIHMIDTKRGSSFSSHEVLTGACERADRQKPNIGTKEDETEYDATYHIEGIGSLFDAMQTELKHVDTKAEKQIACYRTKYTLLSDQHKFPSEYSKMWRRAINTQTDDLHYTLWPKVRKIMHDYKKGKKTKGHIKRHFTGLADDIVKFIEAEHPNNEDLLTKLSDSYARYVTQTKEKGLKAKKSSFDERLIYCIIALREAVSAHYRANSPLI